MKNLTEWAEQKINDEDINYFSYDEFKSLKESSKKGGNCEHDEIGIVTLKILRNDLSDNDEVFAIKV